MSLGSSLGETARMVMSADVVPEVRLVPADGRRAPLGLRKARDRASPAAIMTRRQPFMLVIIGLPGASSREDGHANRSRQRSVFLSRPASAAGGSPSESKVKRGNRLVGLDTELTEKLGRNDLCPCGSGRRFP
jgi:hypothetical protein